MHIRHVHILLWLVLALAASQGAGFAQIDVDRVMTIGRNAIYFKDYVLAIQLFNNAIRTDSLRAEPYYYRAVAKYSLDDYRGAEKDATESLSRNPYIYDAYYLRGIARHSLGRDSLALKDYQTVLQNNPDHKGALHNSAVLYLAQKDTTSTRRTLDYLQRFFPDYAMAYVIDGGLHLLQKDTIGAESLFKKAMDLAPGMTGAYLSMAEIMYDRRDYRAAEAYLDNAMEHNSGEANLYINRALMRYKQNNFRGAMSDYSTAVQLEPNNTLARYNRALLRTQVGELNGALEDLNVVVKNDPTNYFATFNRAILSNAIGNPQLAVSDLDKIIRRYPTFVPAYTERSSAYTMLGKETDARKDLYHASKLMYDDRTANRARAVQDRHDALADTVSNNEVRDERDENIRKFKQLVINSQDKAYNELYREEGESIRGRIQDRETAVALRPMYQLSYYTRTDSQLRLTPKSSYTKALQISGDGRQVSVIWDLPQLSEPQLEEHLSPSGSLFHQAMDYLTIKDHASVVRTLTEAIVADSSKPALYFQRGVSRVLAYQAGRKEQSEQDLILRKGVFEAATKDFQKVLDLVPDFAPALYNLGCTYYILGRYQEAIEYFDRALYQEPDMGVAYFNKGLTLYALGEKDEADACMSKAGALGIYDAYSIIRRMQ